MLNFLIVLLVILIPNGKTTENENIWIQEVNTLRKTERTQPLTIDPRLSAKCRKYAKKLARSRDFKHDSRLKKNIGENIAMSSNPSVNPIEIWKHSTGHRRNMLDRDYEIVGVAMATNGEETYYVMRLK